MSDENIEEKRENTDNVDWRAVLQKSSPPSNAGWWLGAAGYGVIVLGIVGGWMAGSLYFMLFGLGFGAVFLGLDAILEKLEEVLDEIRRK